MALLTDYFSTIASDLPPASIGAVRFSGEARPAPDIGQAHRGISRLLFGTTATSNRGGFLPGTGGKDFVDILQNLDRQPCCEQHHHGESGENDPLLTGTVYEGNGLRQPWQAWRQRACVSRDLSNSVIRAIHALLRSIFMPIDRLAYAGLFARPLENNGYLRYFRAAIQGRHHPP